MNKLELINELVKMIETGEVEGATIYETENTRTIIFNSLLRELCLDNNLGNELLRMVHSSILSQKVKTIQRYGIRLNDIGPKTFKTRDGAIHNLSVKQYISNPESCSKYNYILILIDGSVLSLIPDLPKSEEYLQYLLEHWVQRLEKEYAIIVRH